MATFGQMSPWDAATWFDLPTQKVVSLAMGTNLLIGADPRRVLLIFSNNGGNVLWVGLNPTQASNEGIPIASLGQPLVLAHEWFGPLVQAAWYYTTTIMGGSVTIHSLTLRDWPKVSKAESDGQPEPPAQPADRQRRNILRTGRRT